MNCLRIRPRRRRRQSSQQPRRRRSSQRRRRRTRHPRNHSDRTVSAARGTPGFLLLEDGTLFHGRLVFDAVPTVAEVVFTTNMSGYQEVFTDPSYRGQIVVMTAPMIGNYGINASDPE